MNQLNVINRFLMYVLVLGLSVQTKFCYGKQTYDYVVAKDNSGDFSTIQAAFDHVPDVRKNATVILVKEGIYKEKVVLADSKTNVILVGEDLNNTIITYDDFATKLNTFGEAMGTSGSASFYVFGDGFSAYNITFENSAGAVGQAVAVRIDADRVQFNNCRFLGFQDTLYPYGKKCRQYFRECYIEGTTDFIFGWSTAVFDNCTIYSKKGGQYITAASTEKGEDHGFVFLNCDLIGDAKQKSVYLGRPWRDFSKTVFINCNMDKHIHPAGWHNWGKKKAESTVFYAEYQSTGTGANVSTRVDWSYQLNDENLVNYTIGTILGDWNPEEYKIVNPNSFFK